MNEDIITELSDGCEYYETHRGSRPFSRLLVRLGDECLPLLERLYVNNYELSEWEWYYLKSWSEDPKKTYILSGPFLYKLGIGNIPILYNFFSPYNGQISLTLFIEFICIFTFCSDEQLIPLLISLGNIKSNRVITETQITHFFTSLHTLPEIMEKITIWLFDAKKDENGFISLDAFIKYVLSDTSSFLEPIAHLKYQIISCIISLKTYNNILSRMKYYQEKYGDSERIIIKNETCLESMQRRLFTSFPPPYFFNYRPSLHTPTFSEIICNFRKRYGYSTRPRGNSSMNLSSTSRLKRPSARESLSSSMIGASVSHSATTPNGAIKGSFMKKIAMNKVVPVTYNESVDNSMKMKSLTKKLNSSFFSDHKTLNSIST